MNGKGNWDTEIMFNIFKTLFTKGEASDDTRLPHERYPRILHWRKGDEICNNDYGYPHFSAGHAELLKLTLDGRVFLKDYDQKWNLSIDEVCKRCWNRSAYNRKVDEEMLNVHDYTDELAAFNESMRELQRRDKERGVESPADEYKAVPVELYS